MDTDFKNRVQRSDEEYANRNKIDFRLPTYNGKTHYLEIAKSPYFQALAVLRHHLKLACDIYWGKIQGAYNIDLFMLTNSVSSPTGSGSDSEAIKVKFGKNDVYLVDSSQFGFEPLLMNGFKKVYCYLPSMRGENPNKRHLNQFYHCEAEIIGTLEELKPQVEKFVKFLAETMVSMPNILSMLSANPKISIRKLSSLLQTKKFKDIEFDDAVKVLKDSRYGKCVKETEFGKDISSDGELTLLEILKTDTPIWVNHYDRDKVAFYQKPYKENKVINADFLFPSIAQDSFGGEIVGSGQRQDDVQEMYESLRRQGINPEPYEWYINLRRLKNYKTTSGFGLGIERLIAWVLCRDKIRDVILYPRLKNIISCP